MTIFQSFRIRLENVLGEIRTHNLIGKTLQMLWLQRYNNYTNLSWFCTWGNYLWYNIFKIINKTIILQQKFQILNFQIGITFCGVWSSGYLKGCKRPTLRGKSLDVDGMLELHTPEKDICSWCQIYYVKKTKPEILWSNHQPLTIKNLFSLFIFCKTLLLTFLDIFKSFTR